VTILTGDPGVGKTTALLRVVQGLKARDVKVGGVVSKEIRSNNMRIGFEFIDLASNNVAALASTVTAVKSS
jgi:nucleoside-triphosphatase